MIGQYIFYQLSITMYTCLSWSWHHILSGTISCFLFCCLIITRLKVKVKVKTKHFVNNLLSGEAFHGPNGAPPQETCPGPRQRPEWPPGNSWKTCSQPTPQDSYYSNLEVSFSKRINNPLILKFFYWSVCVCQYVLLSVGNARFVRFLPAAWGLCVKRDLTKSHY